MNVQIIERNGKPEWAVIPYEEYERIREALDDAEDIRAIESFTKRSKTAKKSSFRRSSWTVFWTGKAPFESGVNTAE